MSNTHEHIVKSFDDELQRLTGEIVHMGELAIEQLDRAMAALDQRNSREAEEVVAGDKRIDALEMEVSQDVIRLLALRQPMAGDLREILAALRIASDIERVGDYAANLAKRSLALNVTAPIAPARQLGSLVELAIEMLQGVLEAYRTRDADLAMVIRARDADLDALYTSLFRELLTYMMEDPRNISACTHLLFMAKNIERVGDHATNIAENVWFLEHGEMPGEREKRDTSSTDTVTPPGN
jgi:phosphate transport system protein